MTDSTDDHAAAGATLLHAQPLKALVPVLSFAIAIIASAALLWAVQHDAAAYSNPLQPKSDITECLKDTLSRTGSKKFDISLEDEIANHCIGIITNEYSLQDYDVRRTSFMEQYHESQFILWLVIAITISGVALAAVQLVASYNMSLLFGKSQFDEINFDADAKSLTLGTTVSGLVILAMSFGFFLVYVVYVYPVQVTGGVEMTPRKTIEVPDEAAGGKNGEQARPATEYMPFEARSQSATPQLPAASGLPRVTAPSVMPLPFKPFLGGQAQLVPISRPSANKSIGRSQGQ